MRDWIYATVAVGALALLAPPAYSAPSQADKPAARSAQQHAMQASYRGPVDGHGYSARARRITECLATYPGAYDPKTDRVRIGNQVRRCEL